MYRENDRKDCGKKLMKETEDINLGIDISQVMIDGKTFNRSHSRSPSSSKLIFDMSKMEIMLDVVNVEKLTILLKIVLLCLNKKEKCINCIIYNMWNI